MSIIVETYTTWMLERRFILTMPDGRTYNLKTDETSTLLDDLGAALGDAERVDVDETVCPAVSHGPRNSRCVCEEGSES